MSIEYHKVTDPSEAFHNFYSLAEQLGEGTFGVVRSCISKKDNQQYAAKIIDKSKLDFDEQQGIQLEVDILSQVDHPNVVKIYDIFDEPQKLYMVLELCSGGELFDRIAEKECYSELEAALTIRPIIDAIRYCHDLGIVHRDLKPENLLYISKDPGSIIKISDFGLARFLPEDLMTTACGTPGYVAPEILSGKGYGPEVDFWSIGIILYILLCGFPPFYDEDNEVLFEIIKKGEFDFPSPYWDDISVQAKDLLCGLLQINPKERLTAENVLKHEWMIGKNTPRVAMPKVQQSLKEFQGKKKFKKLGNTVLAVHKFTQAGNEHKMKTLPTK